MADGIRDGKGRILKNTDPFFTELAENYPPAQYTSFCNEFGVGYNQAERIRIEHLGNQTKALKQVLNKWVNAGKEVTRQKIESSLQNAQTGGLLSVVRRHFEKYAEEEESREAGTSQTDATQAKNLAGSKSNTGQSIAMAGNTFYVTNFYALQTAENMKQRTEESEGPTSKKSANENTMSMTKRHRQILKKSATDLVEDLDTDDVLPHLLDDGVITTLDAAKVNAKSTRKEKVAVLLDILPRRGDRAFEAFMKSLRKTEGSSHLYHSMKKLEDTYTKQDTYQGKEPIIQRDSGSSENLSSCALSASSSTVGNFESTTGVTEDVISNLSEKLGNHWNLRKLALALGFRIDQWNLYRASNTRRDDIVCSEGTFQMLCDWKMNTPKGRQRPLLVAALKQAGFVELVDEFFPETLPHTYRN